MESASNRRTVYSLEVFLVRSSNLRHYPIFSYALNEAIYWWAPGERKFGTVVIGDRRREFCLVKKSDTWCEPYRNLRKSDIALIVFFSLYLSELSTVLKTFYSVGLSIF